MSVKIDTNIQTFPFEAVFPNPWQPRVMLDRARIEELAHDLLRNGLIEIPRGRPHPDHPGDVQLAVGHRRFAAWQIAFPGEPFPVDVVQMSDREMYGVSMSENGQRQDLNDIEKARAIQRGREEFGLTLLEAARPFGITSESGASNLVRLLKLPASVQTLAAEGKLAQRHARALLILQRFDRKGKGRLVEKLAEEVISVENPDALLEEKVGDLLVRNGRSLEEVPWKLSWPGVPIAIEPPLDDLVEVPACRDCPFAMRYIDELHCARAECWDRKLALALPAHAAQVAAQLGLRVQAQGETTKIICGGEATGKGYDYDDVRALVNSRRPELRIVASASRSRSWDWGRLASPWVHLATVDKPATDQWLEARAAQRHEDRARAKAPKPKPEHEHESDKQRQARVEAEERAATERRAERETFHRNKHDVLWLLQHVSKLIAERIEVRGPAFLQFVESELTEHRSLNRQYFSEMDDYIDSLDERIERAQGEELDSLRRQHLAYAILADAIAGGYGRRPEAVYDFGSACEEIHAQSSEQFGVRLPPGWNKPPIHRTLFNCWQCGRFGGREGSLTKQEIAEGWIAADAEEGPVFCRQEHAEAFERGARTDGQPRRRKRSKK